MDDKIDFVRLSLSLSLSNSLSDSTHTHIQSVSRVRDMSAEYSQSQDSKDTPTSVSGRFCFHFLHSHQYQHQHTHTKQQPIDFSIKRVRSSHAWDEKYYSSIFRKKLSRGDNKMTLTHFRKAMGLLGLGKGNAPLVELLFRAIAPKGEGVITQKEYIAALKTLISGSPEEKIRFGFTLLDKDNTNKVTGDDIKNILSILYRSYNTLLGYSNGVGHDENRREVSVDDVEEVVKRFDTDHNGDIQFSEWMLGIQRHQDIFTHLAHIVDPEQALRRWNEVSSLVDHLETMLVRTFDGGESDTFKSTYRRSAEIASRLFRETMKKKRATTKELDDKGIDASPPSSPLPPPPSKPKSSAPTPPPGLKARKDRVESADSSVTGSGSEEILKQLRYIRNALDEMRTDMDYLQPVSVLPQTLTERRRVMNQRKTVAAQAASAAKRRGFVKLKGKGSSDLDILDSLDTSPSSKTSDTEVSKEEDEDLVKNSTAQSTIGDVRSLLSERIAVAKLGTFIILLIVAF